MTTMSGTRATNAQFFPYWYTRAYTAAKGGLLAVLFDGDAVARTAR